MKHCVLLVLILLPFNMIFCQQETLAKFSITQSIHNGIDMTNWEIRRGGYFVFYLNEDKDFCFANVGGNINQQSFGRLYSFESETREETAKTWKAHIFRFRWNYHNNYDNKSGYATIQMSKIYKPQGTIFNLKMILPNLDINEYDGYMEWTIDFSDYFKK